jgi:hypothetical protein
MRIFAALVLLAVMTCIPREAQATPLTITGGGLFYTPFESAAGFAGDDFAVFMSGAAGIATWEAFGVDTFTVSQDFHGALGSASVQVGTATCSGPPDDCGTITLASRGLPSIPVNWPTNVPFVARVPFTATGHLNVGNGFDIVGRGILTGIHCSSGDDFQPCDPDTPQLFYSFHSVTVPEPPHALQPVAAAIVMAGMLVVHRRQSRGRRH